MEVGETVEVRIDKIVSGGNGLGTLDGKKVFVPSVLPGELVLTKLGREKPGYIECEAPERIIEANPRRVEPKCPLYGLCGGCNLQHAEYEYQLELKREIILDNLRRTGGMAQAPLIGVHHADAWGYRNRARFSRAPDGRPGFVRRDSSDVIPVDSCPILVPAFNAYLAEKPQMTALGGSGLAYAFGDRIFFEAVESAHARVLGRNFIFDPAAFFQSNLACLELMLEGLFIEGSDWLTGDLPSGGRALDLYCGAGLFSSFLADRFSELTGIEQGHSPIQAARVNVPNGKFLEADMEDWAANADNTASYDFAILDPPRTGLGQAAREWLVKRGPRRVAYVSCDSVTLARDLKSLLEDSYSLESLDFYDFYPQSSHCELLARLSRRSGPR